MNSKLIAGGLLAFTGLPLSAVLLRNATPSRTANLARLIPIPAPQPRGATLNFSSSYPLRRLPGIAIGTGKLLHLGIRGLRGRERRSGEAKTGRASAL